MRAQWDAGHRLVCAGKHGRENSDENDDLAARHDADGGGVYREWLRRATAGAR